MLDVYIGMAQEETSTPLDRSTIAYLRSCLSSLAFVQPATIIPHLYSKDKKT